MKRTLSAALLVAGLTLATPGTAVATVSNGPEPVAPDFDGTVVAMTKRGSTVYVAGGFDTVTNPGGGQQYSRNGVAAFDSRTGQVKRWNPRVSGTVLDLVAAKDGVYLAGTFSRVKDKPRKNLARVSLGGRAKVLSGRFGFNGPVLTVEPYKGTVFVGGDFSSANGRERKRLAAFRRGGAFAIRAWSPDAEAGAVTSLDVRRNGVYVGGRFDAVNGGARHQKLALVDRRRGRVIRAFNPRVSAPVLHVAVTRRAVLAGLGGQGGGGAMAYARSDGDVRWGRRLDGDVETIAVMRGEAYVGGHFDAICTSGNQDPDNGDCQGGRVARGHGASFDLSDGGITSWNPQANSPRGILDLQPVSGIRRLWVGGAFTQVGFGDVTERRVAAFDD